MNPLLIAQIFDIIKGTLSRILPDPAAQAQAQQQAMQLLMDGTFDQKVGQAIALAQANINNTEAQSASLFKSGWRPFTGWSMAVGVTMGLVWAPLIAWAITAATGAHLPPLPVMDTQTMMTLLGGLLGLGGLRTVEKVKGAQ